MRCQTITENIILTQDILHRSEQHCLIAMLPSLDFKIVYDQVKWPFYLQILQKMPSGTIFQKLTAKRYCNCTTALSINGNITKQFVMFRINQQGDPISPFRFVIQMTPLCKLIEDARSSCRVYTKPGYTLPARSFFANDPHLLAKNPPKRYSCETSRRHISEVPTQNYILENL